ncbi:MAG TPA: glycosyltransferase family 4 protein [Puia sp.]|jgi:glycosyltransferase involved in cell wall biosynthesis|nr:glycosyltransferase family 4 protein [Puia sp.]
MKVLFIARASLYKNRGGDTIQLHKTAEWLGKSGAGVEIRLADEDIDYRDYDLIHFFNVMRPADILRHATASGKPYVVSPLFVDYSESDRSTRKGLAKWATRLFSPDRIEYFKVIARRLLNGERVASRGYWWHGQRGSVRRILRGAAMLLPNSLSEYRRLQRRYGIDRPYQVIPNAIDPDLFGLTGPETCREKGLVLCAARIEGIKNQLNLIRAVNGSGLRLILIGAAAVNQRSYYDECREAAGPAVSFIDAVPHEELAGFYLKAQVHALPSWFETTGLSSLEAAAMGCSIVITDKGDTKEYFGDQAVYCDPGSPASIREALAKAVREGPSASLREKILARYTWRHTAAATLKAYGLALGVDLLTPGSD